MVLCSHSTEEKGGAQVKGVRVSNSGGSRGDRGRTGRVVIPVAAQVGRTGEEARRRQRL